MRPADAQPMRGTGASHTPLYTPRPFGELRITHEIAATMFFRVHTVCRHVLSIRRSSGAIRRNDAVRRASYSGCAAPDDQDAVRGALTRPGQRLREPHPMRMRPRKPS